MRCSTNTQQHSLGNPDVIVACLYQGRRGPLRPGHRSGGHGQLHPCRRNDQAAGEELHRAVNIGLVNELKIVCDRMGIDIHEVICAAARVND